jgi:hypothetical protein
MHKGWVNVSSPLQVITVISFICGFNFPAIGYFQVPQ